MHVHVVGRMFAECGVSKGEVLIRTLQLTVSGHVFDFDILQGGRPARRI